MFRLPTGEFIIGWRWRHRDDPRLVLHVRGLSLAREPDKDNQYDFIGNTLKADLFVDGKWYKRIPVETARQMLKIPVWDKLELKK